MSVIRNLQKSFVLLSILGFLGCSSSRECPLPAAMEVEAKASCAVPKVGQGMVYEKWDAQSALVHLYRGGPVFDVGAPEGQKYLERSGATPWLNAEWISAEQAAADELGWASERYVRWLAAASGTIHFPFYPEDWPGELSVEVALRPKMNASMAVRFYKPDGNGGRVWSEPLTADLTPGWHGYRWRVPREYLSKDGMQLMRVSFPGTFFEGTERVSAKFVRIGFGQLEGKPGKFKITPDDLNLKSAVHRVLQDELTAWSLKTGDRLERFFVVPEQASLRFYAAPSAWLRASGKLKIEVQTDTGKKVLSEYPITSGDCWNLKTVDLSSYAGQAIRLAMTFSAENTASVFTSPDVFRPDVLISEPEILLTDNGSFEQAREALSGAQKIVILAIDNLRADRIWSVGKRRAVSGMARLADKGVQGVLMGAGRSHVAATVSFLTAVPAETHQVYDTATHMRTALTTIAEAAAEKGWQSAFYSTTGMIDSTRGVAQGFTQIHQLNKTDRYDTISALNEVSSALQTAADKSLFYVHLSELRLPHRPSEARMEAWGVPGYTGPVNASAMQNVLVMANPNPQDAEQFEAYYDGELADMDDAIAQFAASLPSDTVLFIFGTHGTSLGESALGYEQGLTPWELMVPYLIYMPEQQLGIRNAHVYQTQELAATVLDIIGASHSPEVQSVLVPHDSRPMASADGLTVTATLDAFYRIRREGVDALFTTGLDGESAVRIETEKPVTKRAMREKLR